MTLPAKPLKGSTCNRCGFCCRMERCGLSVQVFGEGAGPCPALEEDARQTYCGVLRNPERYLLEKYPMLALSQRSIPQIQVSIAHALGIGIGCDSVDPA